MEPSARTVVCVSVDNVKARRMAADGTYKRASHRAGEKAANSQEILLGQAGRNGRKKPKLSW